MKLAHIHENQFLICLKRKYSWREFRKEAKVSPETYAESFSQNIYFAIFETSINLIEDYRKYYELEYENINQFLFWRYGISADILDQIPDIENGYLALFQFFYHIEDDEIFWESMQNLLQSLEG
jgi:hypothetical protein